MTLEEERERFLKSQQEMERKIAELPIEKSWAEELDEPMDYSSNPFSDDDQEKDRLDAVPPARPVASDPVSSECTKVGHEPNEASLLNKADNTNDKDRINNLPPAGNNWRTPLQTRQTHGPSVFSPRRTGRLQEDAVEMVTRYITVKLEEGMEPEVVPVRLSKRHV